MSEGSQQRVFIEARAVLMLGTLLLMVSIGLRAQVSETEIRQKLDMVYAGKAEEVRSALPSLLSRYPNDAGVKYIQAVLTTDGAAAAKRYEEIAVRFPESLWADDALYKLYQYDFSIGLYKKADSVMTELRAKYPRSIYLQGASASSQTPQADTPSRPAQSKPDVQAKKQEPVSEKREIPVSVPKPQEMQPEKRIEQKSAPTLSDAKAAGAYVVQAGFFSVEENAKKAAAKYSALAGRQASMKAKTTGETTRYQVVFEGFATADEAKRFSASLRTEHNIESFVGSR